MPCSAGHTVQSGGDKTGDVSLRRMSSATHANDISFLRASDVHRPDVKLTDAVRLCRTQVKDSQVQI